jgi:syringate O-demethylase
MSRAVDWVRPGINTIQPVWGVRGGLLWAVSPGGFQPRGEPRGLIRLGYPILTNGAYDLVNFIAVEPIVHGQKGFSELEHSKLDDKQGKRFWAVGDEAQPHTQNEPQARLYTAGKLSKLPSGAEQLDVTVRVEPFENGAKVRLVISQRSDAPDEIALAIHAETDSAPMEYCILTATMGNFIRARELWFADEMVSMLRNAQAGPNVYPGVPPEFTNWRDEQRAWQETCVLFDLSYHMNDLRVGGPDALGLLSNLAVNSFEGFTGDRAKHFVPCSPDGYVIGDVILFALEDDSYDLVGRAPALNWVLYHAETGGYDVTVDLDLRSALRDDGRRRSYRFQVQGPSAMQVIERALGGAPPELKFFRTTAVTIAGKAVRALRHGMVGQPGWELHGPWDERDAVLEALLTAGAEVGLRRVGGRAYSSNTLESGWIPSPLPAVYSGESTKAYREWLPATGYEGSASIGGSFVSEDIEDYYFTPWDLGYGSYVVFDHDFVGREALEEMSGGEHRRKVTLALDDDDVMRVLGTMFRKEERAKFVDWPSAVYSLHPYDRVEVDGKTVGVSTWIGYSSNEGKMLTLAVLDAEHAEPGAEVTFVWGEEDGGTTKPTVEPHVQAEIGAVVGPVPYVEAVRRSYAPGGWRAEHA